jgi:predicted ATP-grasp superfamily ATP-dependent carboligase
VFVFEYVTGGGARLPGEDDPAMLAMGRCMRDALAADLGACPGWRVSVATCSASTPPPAGRPVVAQRGEDLADFVARQAALHDASWVIAPETGGLLAALQARVPPDRWIGSSADAIALTSRKQATLALLHRCGVATPLAFADAHGLAAPPQLTPAATRWVVKPDDGAGGLATRVWPTQAQARADLRARHHTDHPMTLEPWVDGEAGSLSVLGSGAGPHGAQLLSANRQHIALAADGWLHFGGVQLQAFGPGDARWPAAQALVQQVAQAVPGLNSVWGIDVVWHAQHGPVLIEVNPRLTCAYAGLSQAVGRNLAAQVLAGTTPQLTQQVLQQAAHG